MSSPAIANSPQDTDHTLAWPALPTETEIYILPTGEVVVADLPAELADLIAAVSLQPVFTSKCQETGEECGTESNNR